jgi:Ca-activated chloride channel homolog
MRRLLSITLGLLAVIVVGAVLSSAAPVQAAPDSSMAMQGRATSACHAQSAKTAYPQTLLLGERTKLTLRILATCPGATDALHIVLVLDRSSSMTGDKIRQTKAAASQMVRDLDLPNHPEILVGVVAFDAAPRTYSPLVNDQQKVLGAINSIQVGRGTAIDLGINQGMKELLKARRDVPKGSDISEVMVVLSDGGNNAGCTPVLQAAGAAKGQGVLLITICVGGDCDAACMRQCATSAKYYFKVEDAGGLLAVFDRIRLEIQTIALKKLTVKDVLPDNMRYVEGSAEPPPKTISTNADVLEWETNFVGVSGVTFTLQVEPQQPGYWPTNVEASLTFVDNKQGSGSGTFTIPWVMVLQPDPIPTRTLPPPTSTLTLTPTPTKKPTPTPTGTVPPTPTPIPPPRRKPIYLPILVWHPCVAENWYSDVALVLDLSTSMTHPTSLGRSKIAATLEAAKYFVDGMQHLLPDAQGRHEQVAIVGFNASAWTEQALTSDKAAADAAIDRLPAKMLQFTRLDLAMTEAAAATGGPDHLAANKKVIILMTDGLPNQVPYAPDGTMETTVLNAATVANQDGNLVYTIGVGNPNAADLADRIDPALLMAMATTPTMYYYQPDAEQLKQVYSEIYGTLGCPKTRYAWPGVWP